MTRRKRTPSPDQSRKRVAFDIPASLQQFSVLSRSLAAQNVVQDEKDSEQEDSEQEKDSEKEHAPSNGLTLAAAGTPSSFSPLPPSFPPSSSSSKGIRFKYDPRQFPDQQKWPQPSLNPGAVGHARFLERQWQSARAAQAENMRQAQHIRHQMEQGQERSTTSTRRQSAGSDNGSLCADAPLLPASGNLADPANAGGSPDDSQCQPESTPRRGSRRQRFELDIEQRRQAIIARLMETNPASIATPSSNIQIPASTQAQSGSPPSSSTAADKDGQTPPSAQSELIAALIAKKRAENAANGSLNRWLSARQRHKQEQEAARSTPERHSPSVSQREPSQSPANPYIFNRHPANLSSQTRLASGPGSQHSHDMDLYPLFSSPALTHNDPNAAAPAQTDELGHTADKANATQLPSPSVSSSSPSEQIAQAGHAHYVQQQPLTQHPTQQQPLPPSPSPSVRPNDPSYYQSKPPPMWTPFNTASAAAAVPNNGFGAATNSVIRPGSHSAIYAAFGGTAHFAMSSNNKNGKNNTMKS
ncbi:hypothetical protein DV735_g5820, partial [Chaetothyriales sp. CBS 134920]